MTAISHFINMLNEEIIPHNIYYSKRLGQHSVQIDTENGYMSVVYGRCAHGFKSNKLEVAILSCFNIHILTADEAMEVAVSMFSGTYHPLLLVEEDGLECLY